jgi:probable HAF family extracellular repeat protein
MSTFTARFFFIGCCGLVAGNASAQQYTVTDLSATPTEETIATAINSSGEVSGSWRVSEGNPWHPFVWAHGVRRDLGLLPGYSTCEAAAINDLGHVVGSCYNASANVSKGFVWSSSAGMTPLQIEFAIGINNHGDIVGSTGADGIHAWVIRDGVYTDLGNGIARGINDNGQIVGAAFDLARAVIWDDAGVHDLGTVSGGSSSFGIAISPGGWAVGNSDQGASTTVAAVFTPFGVGNLGTLGGSGAQPNAIRAGLVVGGSFTSTQAEHAFLYDLNGPGVMVDLNDRIQASAGWVLSSATGLNQNGTIVGRALLDGRFRAFMLTLAGTPTTSDNLLLDGGFEGLTPPQLGPPGWVSDDFRQVPAKSETNQPRSGEKNGACWTTDNLDCGMFQDVTAPRTGTYTLTIYANADRPDALVGANVSGETAAFADVHVRGFGNYGDAYVLTFQASEGQTIRVWMYSPAVPGYLVIDDVGLRGPTS